MRFSIGTVVSRRGLGQARSAFRSALVPESGATRAVALVVDDAADELGARGEPFEIVGPRDLALEPSEFDRLALICDERGLAAALAPWLAQLLSDDGAAAVVLVLPDDARGEIPVVPFDAVAGAAGDGAVALVARDGAFTTVIGVGANAGSVVARWQRDFASGAASRPALHRWLEQVPARFPTTVVLDPPAAPTAGAVPAATEAGVRSEGLPYGYRRLGDGGEIDLRMRRLYRDAVLGAAGGGPEPPPVPFGASGPEPFVAWLNEVVFPPAQPSVSRYLGRLWSDREDLRRMFPVLAGETVERYLEWVEVVGAAEGAVPACVRPPAELREERVLERRRNRPRGPRPRGVNVAGWLDAVVGLGEVGRLLVASLRSTGTPVAPIAIPSRLSAHVEPIESVSVADAGYDVNLLCVTGAETPAVAEQLGEEFFAGRRTIGVWFWEAETFALEHPAAFDLVDEIWTASAFTRDAIAAVSPKPVRVVPIPIGMPALPGTVPARAELGFPPERFAFLCVYDFLSTPERKNPIGAVHAFTRAFAPGEGPVLVLKSINGHQRPEALAAVRAAAAGRPDVLVVDRYVSAGERIAMFASCDAYVSLHRSEGYGLPLAEAMALAKPVIATGYSGNLAFMDDSVAYLVDHELRPIGPGCDPYPPESRWAEPDIDHAAALMRAVVSDRDEASARARRGSDRVRHDLSVERCGPPLAAAAEAVRALDTPPGGWRPFFTRGWRVQPHPGLVRRYGYDWLPDGTPVDDVIHRLLARGGGAPDPDAPGGSEEFLGWLDAKVFPRGWPVVSRYLHELWLSGPGVAERFPDLARDPAAYLEWVHRAGIEEVGVPYRLLPDEATRQRAREISPGGSGARGRAYRAARAVRQVGGSLLRRARRS